MSFLTQPRPSNLPGVERVADQQKNDAIRTFESMVATYERGLASFWSHHRFTPQEISDAIGTDAGEMFRLHAVLAATIMLADPTAVLTNVDTLGTFTINEDGTVTAARLAE